MVEASLWGVESSYGEVIDHLLGGGHDDHLKHSEPQIYCQVADSGGSGMNHLWLRFLRAWATPRAVKVSRPLYVYYGPWVFLRVRTRTHLLALFLPRWAHPKAPRRLFIASSLERVVSYFSSLARAAASSKVFVKTHTRSPLLDVILGSILSTYAG
jgi:hypothetical protein